MPKIIKMLILALAWFPAAAAAQEADGAPGPDAFLLAAPGNGPLAELGQKARQGAELALGIWGGGFRLEFLDESRPEALDEIDLGTVALVLGYFTESRFAADAPRYLYLQKPVLLPYLTNEEAVSRGQGLFFRLMPTAGEQGRFLGLEILKLRRRPGRLLLIAGLQPAQAALIEALTETLAHPNRPPEAALAGTSETPKEAARAPAAKSSLKPLDPKAQVITLSLAQALEPQGLAVFGRNRPDLIVLALDQAEALELAPHLAESGHEKTPLWGVVSLAFRDVGAAFARLNLDLNLCLPAVNLASQDNPAVRDFIRQFIDTYKDHPTWISALAFDSLNLAIKAASSGGENMADFLTGHSHHSLAAYGLGQGDGFAPLALMPARPANLGFLP